MKVIFLGTNGWYDTETGNTICTLIQTKQYDIILDAGNGLHRAERHLDGTKPTFLFLSHFHIDHIEGLHILAKFRFTRGLVICGPAGCRNILGTFINQPFTVPLADLPYPVRIMEMPEEACLPPLPPGGAAPSPLLVHPGLPFDGRWPYRRLLPGHGLLR